MVKPGYINCFLSSRLVGKPTVWSPNGPDTNQAVQSQKQASIVQIIFLFRSFEISKDIQSVQNTHV